MGKSFLDKNADKFSRSPDVIDDYVEIVILGPDKTYSKKQYNTWEIFMSDITCMYLFGNTFVIGTSCGTVSRQFRISRSPYVLYFSQSNIMFFKVYFYRLSNWKNFDMKRYASKTIVGKHPIIAIAVKETHKERRFYVCSKFAIHQIGCWLPCVYEDWIDGYYNSNRLRQSDIFYLFCFFSNFS